jgi:hypothetical protein
MPKSNLKVKEQMDRRGSREERRNRKSCTRRRCRNGARLASTRKRNTSERCKKSSPSPRLIATVSDSCSFASDIIGKPETCVSNPRAAAPNPEPHCDISQAAPDVSPRRTRRGSLHLQTIARSESDGSSAPGTHFSRALAVPAIVVGQKAQEHSASHPGAAEQELRTPLSSTFE